MDEGPEGDEHDEDEGLGADPAASPAERPAASAPPEPPAHAASPSEPGRAPFSFFSWIRREPAPDAPPADKEKKADS
jgi:hypothetical protein